MREMTLREIQSIGLDIMKDIHVFCVENNIRYSLAYGSLIGAIRHKGFIPWDDDIDIWMPRPDFEIFSKSYRSSKGYKILSVYSEDNYCYYTKVYEDTNTRVIPELLQQKGEVGVWIDVYAIDGIADDRDDFLLTYSKIRRTIQKINSIRGSYTRIQRGQGRKMIEEIKLRLKCLLYGRLSFLRKSFIEQCTQQRFGDTKCCSSLACVDAYKKNKPEIFDTSDFYDYELVDFETTQFYVSTRYDHVLRTIYGDYMVMPSKKDQISHMSLGHGFFWK